MERIFSEVILNTLSHCSILNLIESVVKGDYMTKLDIAYEDTKVFINANPTLKEKALEVFYWMEQEIEDGASEDNEYELFITGLEDLLA